MSVGFERVRARAEDEAAAMARDAADRIAEALPGLQVVAEGLAIRVSGPDVARRWREAGIGDHLRRDLR